MDCGRKNEYNVHIIGMEKNRPAQENHGRNITILIENREGYP